MQIEITLSVKGYSRFPTGNWFWHEWDHSLATVEQIRDWMEVARQMQANLLLNVWQMGNSGRKTRKCC